MRNFSTRSVGPSGYICRFGENRGAVGSPSDCPEPTRGYAHYHPQPLALAVPNDVIGGNRKVLLNVEYVVPLAEPVDFVVYMDAGNAFAEWEPMKIGEMRGDAGIEIRFFLPVFGAPLRLIYGRTFNVQGNEDTKSFLFSIGTTF